MNILGYKMETRKTKKAEISFLRSLSLKSDRQMKGERGEGIHRLGRQDGWGRQKKRHLNYSDRE